MSRSAVAKHARTVAQKGGGSGHVPLPAAKPAPWTAPPPPSTPQSAGAPHVDPFFRPEDLLTQDNFWAQWNSTFADLDHQLADLQTNIAFQRAQLAQQHTQNVSNINDDAAARGISHSSIRDGNQAQEQTNFTRNDQSLQDQLNNFSQYVQGVKNNFQTQTLPGFNSAQDAQAVQNAQDVSNQYVPPPVAPQVAAPKAQTTTRVAARPKPRTGLHPHAVGQILVHTGRLIGGIGS